MSTRGLMGVVIDGEVKATYNHSDSYPSWLGERMKESLTAGANLDSMREFARSIELVDEHSTPTAEQTEKLMPYANLDVGTQTLDWYCLTRELQGDFDKTLVAGVMIDGQRFAGDSLFCEWAYLANLDTETLEIYRGFNQTGESKGRFAEVKIDQDYRPPERHYDPITLVAEVPFAELADFDMGAFEEELYG